MDRCIDVALLMDAGRRRCRRMEDQPPPLRVVILNDSPDVLDLLKTLFEQEGFESVTTHAPQFREGELDFDQFIAEQDPDVILWDIALPYEVNWDHFQQTMRTSQVMQGRRVVLMTTNYAELRDVAGKDPGAIEVVGKPFDLEQLVDAVRGRPRAKRV
jgi:DNA-binding response OmpR family regulator